MKRPPEKFGKIGGLNMYTNLAHLYPSSILLFLVWLILFTTGNCLVLESDEAEFTFLSSVNLTHIHRSEYHVINVNIPSRQASYIMHLSKPDDLFTPEHLDILKEEVEHYKCLYSGTLSSTHGKGEHVGMASLSSCFHSNGFEGLLFLQNEHYHITPTFTSHGHRHKRFNMELKPKVTVKHKIAKAKTSTENYRNDGLRVPDEELKKARKQMIADQEPLEDEDEEEDDNISNSDSDGAISISTLAHTEDVSGYSNLNDSTMETETMFEVRTRPRNRNINNKGNKNKKLARVIELAIFTDEAFYKEWTAKYPQDTVKKINQYILALVNNMNYLYQQPSMGPKICFRLVNIGIQKDVPSGLKPTKIAENYLDNFCAFAGKKDKNGAVWDHAMMISGFDLKDQSGSNNLGIAFTSTMCLRYYSCSLVGYNKGFETTFTAAHELGHSLGMEHDGELMNKKCDPSKFIMAAVAGAGQINWSPCSNKNVQNFLASGDPRAKVKDPNSIPRCLTKKGSKRNEIRYRTGKYPGQVFNVKAQCQQACEKCTPHVKNKSPYNNVCKTLYCQKASKEILAMHPALEGTPCGQGGKKMCRNGKCQ